MIAIHECRITDDSKYLVVEAEISNMSYYKGVYIDSVIIDTDKTYSEGGPSNNPVYKTSFESQHTKISTNCGCQSVTTEDDCIIQTSEKYGRKSVRLILDKNDLKDADLDNNIFFVYIIATGYPAADTPCGMDNSVAMGIAYNLRPLYNQAMGYIKQLNQDCTMPGGFIDMILRLRAIELAFRTGHYKVAIDHWYSLFKNKRAISKGRRCGCNGSS